MTGIASDLADLGWRPFFQQQLDIDEIGSSIPVRVMAVHRSGLRVAGADLDTVVAPDAGEDSEIVTVGDWLLLDAQGLRVERLLERISVFRRRAPGTERKQQLIAANIDTLFIVTSCNREFNVARLERYLALALEADATPVIVLTKADLTDDAGGYERDAAGLLPDLVVEVLDARDAGEVRGLLAWCNRGQTVAIVGSSGVGKSTLVNSLSGAERTATQVVREGGDKGRHTTSGREMFRLPAGGWLLDTPGMRELQLMDVRRGLDEVFADMAALAQACRFTDCRHETEPGCAVLAALASGEIDRGRLIRWQKLVAEEALNSESLAERRAKGRALGKTIKTAIKGKRR